MDNRIETVARVMGGERTPQDELEAAGAILSLFDQVVADIHLISQSMASIARSQEMVADRLNDQLNVNTKAA